MSRSVVGGGGVGDGGVEVGDGGVEVGDGGDGGVEVGVGDDDDDDATGVTELDVPTEELPTAFLATTVNVYDVPFVKPVNDADKVEASVVTTTPAEDVTV